MVCTWHGDVTLKDGAIIGIGSVVIGPVQMGENAACSQHCFIGGGSVVTEDIPPYCVAVGNPARVIKKYDFKTGQWVRVSELRILNWLPPA